MAKDRSLQQSRHVEYVLGDKVYNCATSCKVIDVIASDCSKGMFAALCVKTAICLRDLMGRIDTNRVSRTPEDIRADEIAVYETSKVSADSRYLDLHNKKTRFTFVPTDEINPLKRVMYIVSNPIMEKLFGCLLDRITWSRYNDMDGIWTKMETPIWVTRSRPACTATLVVGANLHPTSRFYIDIGVDDIFKKQWIEPLTRIKDCLNHVLLAAETCGVSSDEIDHIAQIVRELAEHHLPPIKWSRLADTFMGGLYEYTHNEQEVRAELVSLSEIHYLDDYTRVREALRAYLSGLKIVV